VPMPGEGSRWRTTARCSWMNCQRAGVTCSKSSDSHRRRVSREYHPPFVADRMAVAALAALAAPIKMLPI
jgi:hypothetical protein